ncbi:hypothetical protein MHM93_14390 [Pseudoalteromonas sp. MM17-2]|uniref:hypothetical protein n=1 Tax=Pseudoalteromonas sp. MM17-2 TaxID=2917753 RepID=UPI001EF6818D|nr:hypothetical protein [Pseudoalteromonas sp. MM17-2]MCG7545366.1 hypothetical protein [Pseudoalteromonas sp. MM17-2]
MTNELIFSGAVFNGSIDMDETEFVCVPSKPHYAAVDLCLRANGDAGPNIAIADINNNSLPFEQKKKLGHEMEKRWNNQPKLVELLERSINGLEWYRTTHPCSWSEADEEHLNECRKALQR